MRQETCGNLLEDSNFEINSSISVGLRRKEFASALDLRAASTAASLSSTSSHSRGGPDWPSDWIGRGVVLVYALKGRSFEGTVLHSLAARDLIET